MKGSEDKVKLTVLIDVATRQTIAKYTRPRAIGALVERLVKRYDMECRYGPAKLDSRLSRIEDTLGELVEHSHKIPCRNEP